MVTQTFQFCVFGSEVCSPLDNFLSGPSCGGPVCDFCAEPASWLPYTYLWGIFGDTFRSGEEYSLRGCHDLFVSLTSVTSDIVAGTRGYTTTRARARRRLIVICCITCFSFLLGVS